MHSNVGNHQVYNDGDQRKYTRIEKDAMNQHPPRFESGEPNSHAILDSKDERSIANNLAAAEQAQHMEEQRNKRDVTKDPREPALKHGNKPSRGAEIDAELQAEDEEILRKKGIV
ncbi:hypothetical protein PNOK_0695500 [Pyrrhoderma noxium]|uniref:Uncharacterized protein n=1 Tax=Pyrrhoderma noxium TaxID=2282107 RepID=A0A286UBC0_9AGAM|nr:hypothetical protein PNOK_0695500 [Pyrrhoderma noxium]